MSLKDLATLISLSIFSSALYAADPLTEYEVDNGLTHEPGATQNELISNAGYAPLALSADRYFSPSAGSDIVLSILGSYQRIDDLLIPNTVGNTTASMRWARAGKFVLEELILGTALILQHEVYGHGFRAREFKLPARYKVTPFEGFISFNTWTYNALSPQQKVSLSAGGIEGTSYLATKIQNDWLTSKTIDHREAHLYLLSSLDQTLYIFSTKGRDHTNFEGGHDIQNYIKELNQWYGYQAITASKLKNQAWVDFLDPYLFYSLYSIVMYINEGTQSFEYPMLRIGNYQYLPALRLSLAPYGSEYQWINLISGPDTDYRVTLRYGHTGDKTSTGLDIMTNRFIDIDLLQLDLKGSLWHQPKILTAKASLSPDKLGGALSLIGRYKVFQQLELNAQAGYKTAGFLPGEILRRGIILRVGFRAFL